MTAVAIAALVMLALPVQAQHDDHDYHDHGSHGHSQSYRGAMGSYPMSRDASGTSWQPESSKHEGVMWMPEGENWLFMAHGFALGVYDNQGGRRGDTEAFSASMLMGMAQRIIGSHLLTFRVMGSLDPAMGKAGYPLLLQTGETADGKTPLIDRQHPHDLFMELSAMYSHSLGERTSLYAYFGLPGEPALGPPAFMHRPSGIDDPQAPISHHWMDSTHITYGVATLGLVVKDVKLEGSAFRGAEPDHERWNIEKARLDSYSGRLTYNPTKDWSMQVSYGHLEEPEQLEPGEHVSRFTASVAHNREVAGMPVQSLLALGRNGAHGHKLDAWLLEGAIHPNGSHTIFGRLERVEKNELFPVSPLREEEFLVHRLSAGYVYDFAPWHRIRFGLGASGSLHFLPSELKPVYGRLPASVLLFLRAKLG